MQPMDETLTAAQAAALIGKSARAVRGWISDGDLPASGPTGQRVILRSDLIKTLIHKGYHDEARSLAAIEGDYQLIPAALPGPPATTADNAATLALIDELRYQRDRAARLERENRAMAILLALYWAAAEPEEPAAPPPPPRREEAPARPGIKSDGVAEAVVATTAEAAPPPRPWWKFWEALAFA